MAKDRVFWCPSRYKWMRPSKCITECGLTACPWYPVRGQTVLVKEGAAP
jgi:hypothetical protein